MAVYQGHRPILPGQNSSNMVHNYKGTVGTYSNWAKQSSVHALDEAPLNDVTPGQGKFPGAVQKSQQFTGEFSYKPMELAKYVHGHDVSYLVSDIKQHQGVPSGVAIGGAYGHDGTREFNYSRFRNLGGLGVSDPLEGAGKAQQVYGATFANMGPVEHYIYQGASTRAVENPGETLADRQAASRYGYEQVKRHFGVPSSSALSV